jgi:hypothetical protein
MRILSLTGFVLMFALIGCASAEKRSTAAPGRSDVDVEKVAIVNHKARQRGVRVIWVHMPRKKVLVAANS